MAVPVWGEGGNALVLLAERDTIDVNFQLEDWTLAEEAVHAEVAGARMLDRGRDGKMPAFFTSVEVPSGHFVQVSEIQRIRHRTPLPENFPEREPDEVSITVDLARVRGRVVLRVEVRPFQPVPGGDVLEVLEELRATVLISEEPFDQDAPVKAAGAAAGPTACPPPMPVGVSDDSGGMPADFTAARSVSGEVAWRIAVSEPGLVRLTGADLQAAGVPAAYRDTTRLQVRVRDQVVPVWTSVTGPMGSSDWIQFYGAALESGYTEENVYWLALDDVSPGLPQQDATPGAGVPVDTTWSRVVHAPDTMYRASFNPLDATHDHWFAFDVGGGSSETLAMDTPYPTQNGVVELDYVLFGFRDVAGVDPDHRTTLKVGGVPAPPIDYDGTQEAAGQVSLAASTVSSGTTNVRVEQTVLSGVSSYDASAYVESLTLGYERELTTESLPFFFIGPDSPSPVEIRLQGLSPSALWIVDVTDPFAPVELGNPTITPDGGSTGVTFQDVGGGNRCFAVFSEASVQSPDSLSLVRFRNLTDTGRQADYLVIAPRTLSQDVVRLLTHRVKNGMTVQVAPPEDVYNEFGYGIEDPSAIRRYIGYAYHHYPSTPPGYVLLVGSGSEDPKNNLGYGDSNTLPTPLGWAPLVRTSLEQWYVMVDGADPVADLALGRIPATSAAEMENAVDKLLAFETAPADALWRETSLLVGDEFDASLNIDFKDYLNTVIVPEFTSGGFDLLSGVFTSYRDDLSQSQVRSDIQFNLDVGTHFINYMGHGGVTQWAVPSVWNLSDTTSSANTVYPIFNVFTCRSGGFHVPLSTSMAEDLVLSDAAASAVVGPTGLSDQLHAETLAQAFYHSLAVDRTARLGDVLLDGFAELWLQYPNARELYFYTTFGDPATLIWGGATP